MIQSQDNFFSVVPYFPLWCLRLEIKTLTKLRLVPKKKDFQERKDRRTGDSKVKLFPFMRKLLNLILKKKRSSKEGLYIIYKGIRANVYFLIL